MVGMFAVSEVLRYAVNITKESGDFTGSIDKVFSGTLKLVAKYPKSIMRGSVLGTVVGALPGAGADIASYMSYAISKKFSKEPEKFGTGPPARIVAASSAHKASRAGAKNGRASCRERVGKDGLHQVVAGSLKK